jgi:S1-C subfamily serine protease
VKWNDTAVEGPEHLADLVKKTSPGTHVKVEVVRRGTPVDLTVTVGERSAPEGKDEKAAPAEPKPAYLGIAFGPIPPVVRDYLGLEKKAGIMVMDVVESTPASEAGLKKMDIIVKLEANRTGPVRFMDALTGLVISDKMWLTSLNESKGDMKLAGVATDNKTIADFMTNLEGSPYFSNVDLIASKQTKMGEKQTFKKFTITCRVSDKPLQKRAS